MCESYSVPKLPIASDYSPFGRYSCVSCSINKSTVDHEEKIVNEPINQICCFKSKAHLEKHKLTKKHINNVKNGIICKKCGELFSKEGFEIHKSQNTPMLLAWRMKNSKDPFICNNFIFNSCRFHSFEAMEKYKSDYKHYIYKKKIYDNDLRFIRERDKGRKAKKRLPNGAITVLLNNREKNRKK